MHVGRTSDDKKENTIKVRVNDEMKKHLEKKSARLGLNLSEYLRKLIEKDMKQS